MDAYRAVARFQAHVLLRMGLQMKKHQKQKNFGWMMFLKNYFCITVSLSQPKPIMTQLTSRRAKTVNIFLN